jgi:HSP20 family protein
MLKNGKQNMFWKLLHPGFEKEDFQISLDKNLLTVSGSNKEIGNKEGEKLVRNEYEFKAFKRSFTLDEKIGAEAISAQYVNGVLTLNLPKMEEVKPQTKQISVQ